MLKPEVKWLREYLDTQDVPELNQAVRDIYNWSLADHGYESKNTRIAEWSPSDSDIYSVVCNILIGCFIHGSMTYQAMIGFIQNGIGCDDQVDRIKTAAELIALAYQHDLIVITKEGDTMYITTEYELDVDIPEFYKHMPEPKPVRINSNPILGCRLKQHDYDVCLEHINTMNRIGLTLEHRVIADLVESNKDEDQDFVRRSFNTYNRLKDSTFYLKHNYDTRGRTYCEGYYVNYQGASFKKAIIQLAKKELI